MSIYFHFHFIPGPSRWKKSRYMYALTLRQKTTTKNRSRIRLKVNLKQLLLRLNLRQLGLHKTKHAITCMRMYLSAVATALKSSEKSKRAETAQTKNLRLYLASWTAWIQSLEKQVPSFWLAATRCLYAIELPSSRGGRSEAQHDAPRQGSALPIAGVPDHYNAVPTKY